EISVFVGLGQRSGAELTKQGDWAARIFELVGSGREQSECEIWIDDGRLHTRLRISVRNAPLDLTNTIFCHGWRGDQCSENYQAQSQSPVHLIFPPGVSGRDLLAAGHDILSSVVCQRGSLCGKPERDPSAKLQASVAVAEPRAGLKSCARLYALMVFGPRGPKIAR